MFCAAIAAIVALAASACTNQVPETIYVYPSPAPSTQTATVTGQPTDTPVASIDVTPTPTPEVTPTPASTGPRTPAPTMAPTPFHPPTVAFVQANLYFSHYDVPNVICGVPYTLHATIRNSGQAAAGPTTAFAFDEYPEFNTVAEDGISVPPLGAGGSVNVSFSFTVNAGCGQTHVLRLRADASAVVGESNEADNYLRLLHTVRASNLYPTDLTVPHDPPCDSVPAGVRVNNNGDVPTPSDFLVRFRDTASGVAGYSRTIYVSTGVLPAHSSRIVSTTFTTIDEYSPSVCNRTHTISVSVDSSALVPETSETDNTASVSYHP